MGAADRERGRHLLAATRAADSLQRFRAADGDACDYGGDVVVYGQKC